MVKINQIKGNEDVLDKFSITTCGKVIDTSKNKEIETFKSSGYRVFLDTKTHNKTHVRHVHNLVAEAFIGSKPNGVFNAVHKDGNIYNNNINNIAWIKPKSNKSYIMATNNETGEKIIVKSRANFCRKHNIDNSSLGKCLRGELKSTGGFKFEKIEER